MPSLRVPILTNLHATTSGFAGSTSHHSTAPQQRSAGSNCPARTGCSPELGTCSTYSSRSRRPPEPRLLSALDPVTKTATNILPDPTTPPTPTQQQPQSPSQSHHPSGPDTVAVPPDQTAADPSPSPSPSPAKSSRPPSRSASSLTPSVAPRPADEAPPTDSEKSPDTHHSFADAVDHHSHFDSPLDHLQSPPPQYPTSEAEASASTLTSLVSYRTAPPPFSSLFVQPDPVAQHLVASLLTQADHFHQQSAPRDQSSVPAYEPPVASGSAYSTSAFQHLVADTNRALPQHTKAESSSRPKDDDAEPPPAYDEGYSPLQSFAYVMAAAGGAASIITQVQQGGPPINTLGGERPAAYSARSRPVNANCAALDVGADETITMDLRYVHTTPPTPHHNLHCSVF